MTIEEFGKQIKTKYPEYGDIADIELGQKMIAKYPQYQDMMNNQPEEVPEFLAGHSVLKGISDFVGTTGLAKGMAQGIFLKFTPEGKQIMKDIESGKIKYEDLLAITGEPVTTKEIIGSAIRTGTTIGAFGKAMPTVLGRIGVGTAVGAGIGAGTALEEGGGIKEVAKGTAIGAGAGLVVSGLFEGVGALLRKASGSEYIQKRTGATYTKELQPPRKEIAKSIEKGFQTFGEQVADVVDGKGNPVYTGTYNTLLKKSKGELSLKGTQLISELKSAPKVTVTRKELVGEITKIMENEYGKLSASQIKQIAFETSRIPAKMDLLGVEKAKRMLDNLIPDSFWSKLDDPAVAFPSLVKYTLRDNARKLINIKTANPLIQKLNNELGIAMDVRKLAANQLAQRQLQKISGQGGYFYKLIGRFIDDWVFNPAITTRSAQALRTAGQKIGERPIIQATKFGITKGLVE